jgi:hypothetical protein
MRLVPGAAHPHTAFRHLVVITLFVVTINIKFAFMVREISFLTRKEMAQPTAMVMEKKGRSTFG